MHPADTHRFSLGTRQAPIFGRVLPSLQAYWVPGKIQRVIFAGCPILKWGCAHRGWRRGEVKKHAQTLLQHRCAHRTEGNDSSAPRYLLPGTCLPTHASRHPHPYRNLKFASGKNPAGLPGGAGGERKDAFPIKHLYRFCSRCFCAITGPGISAGLF